MTAPLAVRPAAEIGPDVAAALSAASPPWLADRRRAAWDVYATLPMPSSARVSAWIIRRIDVVGSTMAAPSLDTSRDVDPCA